MVQGVRHAAEAGGSLLPAQTTAGALGGHPLQCQVEVVDGCHGDEDDQHHPGDARHDPDSATLSRLLRLRRRVMPGVLRQGRGGATAASVPHLAMLARGPLRTTGRLDLPEQF